MEIDSAAHCFESHDHTERSNKKQKNAVHEEIGDGSKSGTASISNFEMQEVLNPNAWGTKSFAEATRDQPENHPGSPTSFYMGEDDDREFDELDSLCEDGPESGHVSTSMSPKDGTPEVKLSDEKYHSLFKPWRGALVLKLLGRTVSFRIME